MTTGSWEAIDASRIKPNTVPVLAAIGRWTFRHRTWLPVPFAIALLLIIPDRPVLGRVGVTVGMMLVVLGEGLRLWAVRHIGVISRTRAERLGPLITTGPFAFVRNPMYLGNLLLWSGFVCWTGAFWLLPISWLFFGGQYHLMAQWEEHLLEARIAQPYREYVQRVPAWIPALAVCDEGRAAARFNWTDTLFAERGTLIGLMAMAGALSIKLA